MTAGNPPRFVTAIGSGRPSGQATAAKRVASSLGVSWRPWQAKVANGALARRGDRWRFPLVTVTVPRQAGKTTLVSAVAVARCLAEPEVRVFYTAQSRQSAIRRFEDMVRLLRRSSFKESTQQRLSAAQWGKLEPGADWRFVRMSGHEEIAFANGSTLSVYSPNEDGLHGSVSDLVIIDEARFFSAELGAQLMAAALPTQATRDGQVWIVSTAGSDRASFLATEAQAGRSSVAEPDSRRFYAEWSAEPDTADEGMLEAAWLAHPAAGLTGGLSRDAIEVAHEQMPPWEFAREYGNVTRADVSDRLIPQDWWARAQSSRPLPPGRPCFGVEVAPDRSSAVVVACVDGTVEVVHAEPGVQWLAPWLIERQHRHQPLAVAIDAGGPAGPVAERLADTELADVLVLTRTRDLVAACTAFFDGLATDPPSVMHRWHAGLDDAVANAAQRRLGQSWAFAREGGGHLIVAAALAFWAEAHQPVSAELAEVF